VTVTRAGSAARIYIDGRVTGTADLPESLPESSLSLRIGHDHDGGFVGIIDEVRIYNLALSAAEVQDLATRSADQQVPFAHITVDTAFGGIRAVGDIDGVGFPDLVHSYWYKNAPLAWYAYEKPDKWTRSIIRRGFYPCTDDFELADLDADGDLDIVIAWADGKHSGDDNADNVKVDSVKILCYTNPLPDGDPHAGEWPEHLIGSYNDPDENYNKDIEVTDFDRDGKLDVVARSHRSVMVYRQYARNAWRKIQSIAVHPHEGMAVGDLDGDGDPDIVLNGFWLESPEDLSTDWSEHSIDSKWWNQTGDWTANNCKIEVTDVNGDGRDDVLLSHSERPGYPISWYEFYEAKHNVWQEHIIGHLDFVHTLQAADFDRDGDVDVLAGEMAKSSDPDEIVIFRNDGSSLTWTKQVIAEVSIYSGKIADIGGDGDMDVVANRNWNLAPLEIWENRIVP
jgi:hypothetical protein